MSYLSEPVYLSLGSNLGDRARNLSLAAMRLALLPGVELVRLSPVYETAPWGVQEQPAFLNMVARARVRHSPVGLLDELKRLEEALGREPSDRWGPRRIDIDILLFGGRRVSTPRLTIPHPRIAQRQFVLVPLADIAPEVEVSPGDTAGALARREGHEVSRVGCLADALRVGRE